MMPPRTATGKKGCSDHGQLLVYFHDWERDSVPRRRMTELNSVASDWRHEK